MKLCPQCEFIYEDDQGFCDMDGKELVYDPGPREENVPSRSPKLHEGAAIPASLTAGLPAIQPTRWKSRRSVVAALAAIILVALLFVVYYAQTHQPRSGNAKQASNQTSIQSSNQSTQLAPAAQEPAPDLVSGPTTSLTPSPEESESAAPNETASSSSSLPISSAGSFSRTRMASNPVSAGGSAADGRAPVVVWLTNGASIKADEAWERREGIWYRQAGMVTFIKRSRVSAIQRLAVPNPRLKSTAVNAEAKNRKPENVIAQNQPRAGKPEAASTKKESRVTSFLKKTGKILRKPFKF